MLRGHAVFELDGDRVDAQAGTLVFAPPHTRRSASAVEGGTMIICWRARRERRTRRAAGNCGPRSPPSIRRASTPRSRTAWSPLSQSLRSIQCCFQPRLLRRLQCGRTSDALDHLRHAVEMSEEFRDSAKADSDLDALHDEPTFRQLIHG